MGFLSNKIWVRIFLGHPVLVPICKNKNGDVSDTGDNRLVSLATIVLRQNILNMRKNRNSPLLQQQDRNSMFLNFLQYGIKI